MVEDGFEDHLAAMGWRKGPFLKMLAVTIAELHRRGIYHGDLNPTNILVDLEGDLSPSTFCFLDNARCRLMKKVPYQLRLRDLSGLNHPRLDSISARDRLRFFSLYCRHLGRRDGMEMIQDIWRRSIRPRRRHGAGS
jgi:serine/threonine protein kinase